MKIGDFYGIIPIKSLFLLKGFRLLNFRSFNDIKSECVECVTSCRLRGSP